MRNENAEVFLPEARGNFHGFDFEKKAEHAKRVQPF